MKINEAYNIWANSYDSNVNVTRDLELFAGKRILGKFKFNNILELGCGTGKNTSWLINICDNLVGIDFSSEMLVKAKEKIKSDKVKFKQFDILNEWNFEENKFDLITSSLVFEHIEDLNFIFSEGEKSLKNNGYFYICELHPFKQYMGSKARFEVEDRIIKIKSYIHHISDYIDPAHENKFKMLSFNEWFDDEEKSSSPRLVSFLFQKE